MGTTLAASAAAGLAAGLALCGCAGGHPAPPRGAADAVAAPWQVPASEYPTQRIFRLSLAGSEGEASMRLTLRLAAPGRYQLLAADLLGRAVWALDFAAGESALLLDHRHRSFCRWHGQLRLPEEALAEVAPSALPAVLLGRLPAAPASGALRVGAQLDFKDAADRRWTASLAADGAIESWSLWQEGRPLLWWSGQDRGGVLSHRAGAQARWRQTALEALQVPLAPLQPPQGFAQGRCDDGELP